MIFTMDVVGNCTTQSNELSSVLLVETSHLVHIVVKWTQRGAGFTAEDSSFSIEFDHAIHSLRRHKNAAIIETGVPVTFAHSIG